MKKSAFNIRALRAQANALNGVIHSRNLWICLPGEKRRVINCEVNGEGLTVQDLYSGNNYLVSGNKFEDGYGKEVIP